MRRFSKTLCSLAVILALLINPYTPTHIYSVGDIDIPVADDMSKRIPDDTQTPDGKQAPDDRRAPVDMSKPLPGMENIVPVPINIAAKIDDTILLKKRIRRNGLFSVDRTDSREPLLLVEGASYFEVQGDWVYYFDVNGGDNLYRMKADGTGKERICGSSVINMIFSGEWIYYLDLDDNYSIYRIKTDGSGQQKLSNNEEYVSNMFLHGDWLYFSNSTDKFHPYRVRIDGTGRQKLADSEKGMVITAINNGLIYCSELKDGSIVSFNLDGTGKRTVIADKVDTFPVFDSGWLYYINKSDGSRLYKVRYDGSDKTKICNADQVWSFMVAGDWIMYESNWAKLFRVRTDGLAGGTIMDIIPSYYTVRDGKLYFKSGSTDSGGLACYRAEMDGTRKEKITSAEYAMALDTNNSKRTCYTEEIDFEGVCRLDAAGNEMNTVVSGRENEGYTEYGGWVYYSNPRGIFKASLDGAIKKQVFEGHAYCISIWGGWIYYLGLENNVEGSTKLFKISVDGLYRQKVIDGVENCKMEGEWLRYLGSGDTGRLYRGGRNTSEIGMENNPDYNSMDADYYYCEDNEGIDDKIMSISLRGGVEKLVIEKGSGNFQLSGEWLYYETQGADAGLYRQKVDGTEKQRLIDGPISYGFAVEDGWVYYGNLMDGGRIYRLKDDGTVNERLTDLESASFFSVVDGWVYFSTEPNSDATEMYRVRIDGTEQQAL